MAYDKVSGDRSIRFFTLVGWAIALAVIGFAGSWLFDRLTAKTRARIVEAPCHEASVRLVRVILRSLLDLLSIAAFVVPVLAVYFAVLEGDETVRLFVITYVSAIVVVRLVGAASRVVIAPYAPALRFATLSNAAALYCHRWLMWIASITAFGFLTCGLFQVLGIPEEAHLLMVMGVGLVITGLIITFVWHSRQPVGAYIRGKAAHGTTLDRLRAILADIWPVVATVYVALVWLTWAAGLLLEQASVTTAAILSLLMIAAVPLADRIAHILLDHFLPHTHDDDDVETDLVEASATGEAIESSAAESEPQFDAHLPRNAYAVVIHHAVRVIIVATAFLAILGIWGINLWATAEQTMGGTLARAVLDVVVVLVIAFIGWELIRTAIDLKLAAEGVGPDGENGGMSEGEGGKAGSRVATMLPLLRKFLAIVIIVMVTMIILSSLGVDIGPLLAGAGVVGLAIGFGAQTLVRDIVSGVFYLLDDAFRMGEYIDTGDVKGTVEGIRLRSLRLRHHRGPVNTIPYGELSKITNYSRDWVVMRLEFRVPYDTNMIQVKKIIREIGAKLQADPDMGPNILQTLKSQGVFAMEDSAIVVRVKFMAIPGEQFLIRRAAYQLIQQAFAEHGIKFAHRQVTVHVPSAQDAEDEEDETKPAAPAGAAALATAAADAPST
ncbi:MAG: mechanosensitive ion channel family protein [Alphaproteobacteria bacterium]|nr:mechanosensitive ion channel family protein [Alphaproteobacteria bacterium]